MSKSTEKQLVRQRDRFLCQLPSCGKAGEQYAHIIADADGGKYDLNNLIHLCCEHHNWLESARTSPQMKAELTKFSLRLRDRPKEDGLLSQLFTWLPSSQKAVVLGGGCRFLDQENILESLSNPQRPYLKLAVDGMGIFKINAYFEDSVGKEFMKIVDNKLEVDTIIAWDIIIERRRFSLIHAARNVELTIRQKDNLELWVTGRLYLNGGYYHITNNHILDVNDNNLIRDNTLAGSGRGLLLAPGGLIAF